MTEITKEYVEENKDRLRIKTLEEFGGKVSDKWNSAGKMDFLLGKKLSELTINEKENWFNVQSDINGIWSLIYSDLTLIKDETIKPKIQYKPGTDIDNFVQELVKCAEVQIERKRWLETYQRCVLNPEVKEAIKEALAVVLNSAKFEEWGFTTQFEKGLTNSILLYGAPGTGKTMVAECIAAILDKNIIRVDAGVIQSPIPGQTEKNIKKVFNEAKTQNAVVLLDECDSLLYNRNQVGAILSAEINCFLSEIERFDGVVVMTTNRIHKLDEALERRIVLKLEVTPPNKEARLQIWKNLVPEKMPVKKIDFNELAEVDLTGGEIKNAILLAARKAIGSNVKTVTHEYFEHAVAMVLESKEQFKRTRPKQVMREVLQ